MSNDMAERVSSINLELELAKAQEQLLSLRQALDSRDIIGQAKGILMERHRITGEQAFLILTRVSQGTNVKLREVAHRFVEEGTFDEFIQREELRYVQQQNNRRRVPRLQELARRATREARS